MRCGDHVRSQECHDHLKLHGRAHDTIIRYDDPVVQSGDVLADRFVIDDDTRRGGIGVVYRGWDLEAEQAVAIKFLTKLSPNDVKRFEREADLLAEADLPGVVRHVQHGTTEDGRPYLVMQWLDGETVGARLESRGFDLAEAVALVVAIATPLAALHARGLVHRDLKPENLILASDAPESVVLIDFGLARTTIASDTRLTTTGCILGTPGYMAPEQIRAEPEIDARADVFALGCVLYECLTGYAAFAGGNFFAVRTKILLSSPTAVRALCPEAPPALEALVEAMIAKRTSDRPPDAAATATALRALGALPPSPRRRWHTTRPETLRASWAPRPEGATHVFERWSGIVLVDTAGAGDSVGERDALATELAARGDELRRVARGARLELLDGALVAIVPGSSERRDLARQLVNVARGLAAVLPLAIVIAASGDEPFDELVDRAAESLDTLARAAMFGDTQRAIFLDLGTGDALGQDLPLVRYAAGYRIAT